MVDELLRAAGARRVSVVLPAETVAWILAGPFGSLLIEPLAGLLITIVGSRLKRSRAPPAVGGPVRRPPTAATIVPAVAAAITRAIAS
jgi:hypothetical protein